MAASSLQSSSRDFYLIEVKFNLLRDYKTPSAKQILVFLEKRAMYPTAKLWFTLLQPKFRIEISELCCTE
jgi:hypothetical protein